MLNHFRSAPPPPSWLLPWLTLPLLPLLPLPTSLPLSPTTPPPPTTNPWRSSPLSHTLTNTVSRTNTPAPPSRRQRTRSVGMNLIISLRKIYILKRQILQTVYHVWIPKQPNLKHIFVSQIVGLLWQGWRILPCEPSWRPCPDRHLPRRPRGRLRRWRLLWGNRCLPTRAQGRVRPPPRPSLQARSPSLQARPSQGLSHPKPCPNPTKPLTYYVSPRPHPQTTSSQTLIHTTT